MLNYTASLRRVLSLLICAATLAATPAQSASLIEITNFGQNPSGLRMHVYAPDALASPAPILVGVHWCTGSGPAFFSGTEFQSLADRYGFIVIYPSATRSGNCFDVSSPQALQRGGGSDPVGILSMVNYVIQSYGADANRVYVTGVSSGAMMTNVLLGVYPDVFKAGAAFVGVPFGCFATTDGSLWNTICSEGNLIKTPQEWGNLVRAAYPGYTGPRPRMQLWHGTNDTVLRYPNLGEEIKQWTNVLGVSQTPAFTDSPQANWTRTRYGGTGIGAPVEAISIAGADHNLIMWGMGALAIQFFGLDTTVPTNDTQAPSTPANLISPSRTSNSVSLSWSASTDNVGVTGYEILRAPGTSGGSFAQIATATSTSLVDNGLTPNTPYHYQVRARDAAGNVSAVSNTLAVTTQSTGTGGGPCAAAAVVQTQWQGGYVIQPVTVSNNSTAAINGWTVTFTLPANHAITNFWNATLTMSGQTVTARNAGFNGAMGPGGSTTFGFQATRPAANTELPSGYACTSP
jgi:poly(hydroxyalkanoate) depolymerase family esterase